MSVHPYKINVPQEKIDRLKAKLALTDFPDEIENAEWDYGSPLKDIKDLVKYWHNEYDWRATEKKLNELPHYITRFSDIEQFGDIDIHFIHQRSADPDAIPLLFAHGWPGSFEEVTKILPGLTQASNGPETPSFHVVAPSLPNYGFSSGVTKRGFQSKHTAQIFHKLMLRLGYNQYITQGGDMGYAITRFMGLLYPGHCKASHVNFPLPKKPTKERTPELYEEDQNAELSEYDKAGFERTEWFRNEGNGYMREHSTKPQTIGYSLRDSPVGLLAWIYEKLHDWTDAYPWTAEEVCTWVSIYYFSTAGPNASLRPYYENGRGPPDPQRDQAISGYVPHVKLGVTKFPKELYVSPARWNKQLGPLVFEAQYDRGGHFAAWETPDVLVNDLRTMFGRGGGAHGVISKASGTSHI